MSALRVSLTNPAGTHHTELLAPGDRLHFHRMSHRWAGEPKVAWDLRDGLLVVNGAVVGAELPDLEPATLTALAAQHRGALHSLRLVRSFRCLSPLHIRRDSHPASMNGPLGRARGFDGKFMTKSPLSRSPESSGR